MVAPSKGKGSLAGQTFPPPSERLARETRGRAPVVSLHLVSVYLPSLSVVVLANLAPSDSVCSLL